MHLLAGDKGPQKLQNLCSRNLAVSPSLTWGNAIAKLLPGEVMMMLLDGEVCAAAL